MNANKPEAISRMLSQREPRATEITFFFDEITDAIIQLTKKRAISWIPFSEFHDHYSYVPKKLKSIIDSQMENGLILSKENSYYVEYNNTLFVSAYYKRIGTERIAFGLIVLSALFSSDDGVGLVNSESAMRLNNLIRYNMTSKKMSNDEKELNYLKSVFESLKNEPLV